MKIERIDDKTIKCYLSKDELAYYHVDYSDFISRTENAQRLLREIMETARSEVGYKPPKIAFEMQIMMGPEQGMVLTFSEKDPAFGVDADKIGIWGWSYGGYETLMAMSTDGSNYACGVAIAPVTSWKFYDTIYAERFMRTPQENPDGYRDGAPLEAVDKLKGRVLIMFGSADDNVHIINAMQYIAKLHQQNVQFDMMVFPNMNHSINGCDVRYPLYQKVLDFYNANLK